MEKRQCRDGGGSCVHFSSQTKNTACLLWMHCKRVNCHCAHAHMHTQVHTLHRRQDKRACAPPGQEERVGRLSPGPLPDTPGALPQPRLPAPPKALPTESPELVKGFDFL